MGVIESSLGGFISSLSEGYQSFVQSLPMQLQAFINLLLITIIVVIYAVSVWKFYVFISTKDILRLNLNKYNKATHPVLIKVVAGLLYLVEYIIILPMLIFLWFTFFAILLVLITKGLEPKIIVLIAAITIASIRATSYLPKYGETVAGEIAKIVPLTLLAFSLTNPLFFNLGEILNGLTKLPQVFGEIKFYFFFIITLELILRGLTFVFSMFMGKGGTEIEEETLEEGQKSKKRKKK